jgi:hypothetical protein
MVATPLIARAKLSVPVNGILVPIKAAAESLRRFCTPAFFHHEGQSVFEMFLELDMARTLETVDPASVKAIFAVGYPTAFGDVTIKCDEESNVTGMDMELRWVKLYLVPDGPALLDAENRRAMVQDPNYDQETIDPDGMSGAPVFFVWLDPSFQANLGFVGMITHGRDRRYMIYDGALLRQVVGRYMDEGRSS